MAISVAKPSITLLYGGSFDPPHKGHEFVAEKLQAQLPDAQIIFLPTAGSPLKSATKASSEQRHQMLKLCTHHHASWQISAYELAKTPPCYTIDTLKHFRQLLGKDQPLAFVMGMDSFLDLPKWREWQRFLNYSHLIVVDRPPFSCEIKNDFAIWWEKHRISALQPLELAPCGSIAMLTIDSLDIASRDIRAALAQQHAIAQWLNPAVADYIDQHHLYCGEAEAQ